VRQTVPAASRWICETLLSTDQIWKGRVIVLLGDTIYSQSAMNNIFNEIKPLCFFGTYNEIFALSFDNPEIGIRIHSALNSIVRHAERFEDIAGVGKLWVLYRYFAKWPYLQPVTWTDPNLFHYVRDWTTDIDTPERYRDFLRDVVDAGLLDKIGQPT